MKYEECPLEAVWRGLGACSEFFRASTWAATKAQRPSQKGSPPNKALTNPDQDLWCLTDSSSIPRTMTSVLVLNYGSIFACCDLRLST